MTATPRRRNWLVTSIIVLAAVVAAGGALAVITAAPPPDPADDPSRLVRTFSGNPPAAAPDARTLARLGEIATMYASGNGEKSPSSAVVYRTTRQRAQQGIGAGIVDSDQSAYLIVLTGNFTAYFATSPVDGKTFPTGTVMTITVDSESMRVVDWSVQKNRVNEMQLGRPIDIRD